MSVTWHPCDIDECDYKSKRACDLKTHKADIHGIGVTWHPCDIDECDYKSKQAGSLKRHKANIHGINVTWHMCDVDECKEKFKHASHLKRHKADVHGINVTWHHCDIGACKEKFKHAGTLKLHKAHIHDIYVTWYHCNIDECDYKSKQAGNLKRHRSHIHGINVTWHHCDIGDCKEKFKESSNLKQHTSHIHGIDVTWHHCNIDECKEKFKHAGTLKTHKSNIHDIGTHTCEFCCYNRNSHISYADHTGIHKICRKCYKKATGKESRIEHIWSDYIDRELGTEFLSSSDRSLKSNGGCSSYRPDKLYIGVTRVELDECDEYQHKRNNGNYSCDEKRISDMYDEFDGNDLVVIRWNPDSYKVPTGYTKKNRQERLYLFVELKKKLRTKKQADRIHIYYMFYDIDNPRISTSLPYTMIYDKTDIHGI